MKKVTSLIILSTILHVSTFSQSKHEIDSLLYTLNDVGNSKDLSTNTQAKRIISYGRNILPILTTNFLDTTITNIKSDCQNTLLTKGEVAIILADRIENMPYYTLTGIQNCLVEFCKDNTNLIEYYISAIRRMGVEIFQKKYLTWLSSKDRKKIHAKRKKLNK